MQGRFDDVLTGVQPGVTVHAAALTHKIRQESNVVVVLPFFSRTIGRRTRARGIEN